MRINCSVKKVYVYNFNTEKNLVNLKPKPGLIKGSNYNGTNLLIDLIDENGHRIGWTRVGIEEGVPYMRKFYLKEADQERAEQIVSDYFSKQETSSISGTTVYVVTYVFESCDKLFGIYSTLEQAQNDIMKSHNIVGGSWNTELLEMNTIKMFVKSPVKIIGPKIEFYITPVKIDEQIDNDDDQEEDNDE